MPLLFDEFDADSSGSIERNELVEGIGKLIHDGGLNVDLAIVYEIMDEVDTDGNGSLDRREFGFFLSHFAVKANLSLDEVTFYLMEHKKAASKQSKEIQNSPTCTAKQECIQDDAKGWSSCDKLFRMMDTNDDGILDRNELWTVINRLRCTNKKVKIQSIEFLKIIEQVDTNDDKKLDPREFEAFISRLASATGLRMDELTNLITKEIKKDPSVKAPWHGIKFLLAKMDTALAEESMHTIRSIQKRRGERARSA